MQVIRYVTARSFDGYSWQTLERKARFIREVMSPSMDAREIGDIGDTVLSFSEAKALATNNPLLMDKAEADATLARLVRAERAHPHNQDTLRRAITRHEHDIGRLTQLAADLGTAVARRQDTRGEAFTMTVDGQRYRKRADAGHRLLGRLREEAAQQLGYRARQLPAGELGGFPLTATITGPAEQVQVALAFDGAPGTEMTFTRQDLAATDPTGLITRLENRLTGLETAKTRALAGIDHARSEIDHATASLGKPFPQAADLAAARQRGREIDEQLEAAAAPPQPPDPEPGATEVEVPARHDVLVTPRPVCEPEPPAPPWPSAAERRSGPAPSRPGGPRATWAPGTSSQNSPAQTRHGRSAATGHPPAAAEHTGQDREAGQ